ncbi:MAG TPA: TIM barrel protein [Candidatus Acidoferrales bacterium]|nr:TIM barrel protein [Candidatus Acidoferrales bacterium]
MDYTRRDLGKLALAALPAATLAAAKLDSNFGGVQIGVNAPYSFHNMPGGADDIVNYCTQTGIGALELRLQPVEAYLKAPAWVNPLPAPRPNTPPPPPAPAASGAPPKKGRAPMTPEQIAERKAAVEALDKWRLSQSMDGFKTFRKKYEDAGLLIQIVKFDGIGDMKDEVVDYCFEAAKALGAHAISCEIPVSRTKHLGAFAEKHKMMVGYHGHGNLTDPEAFGRLGAWEQAFWYSKYNGANVDIGHFFAANGFSPAEWIRENHTRVTHVHIKDRKADNGPNVPFGQGDTPIKEILLLMKRERYRFQATLEFEYPVPEGSNLLAELTKCVQYCREILA